MMVNGRDQRREDEAINAGVRSTTQHHLPSNAAHTSLRKAAPVGADSDALGNQQVHWKGQFAARINFSQVFQ